MNNFEDDRSTPKAKDSSLLYVWPSVAVLLLYMRLVDVADYPLTVGGISAILVAVMSMRKVTPLVWPVTFALLLCLWPLLVMTASSFTGAALTPEVIQFFSSYALWLVSVVLISLAFITRSSVNINSILAIQVVLTGLMATQFIGARFSGNMLGYEIVAPLLSIDIFDSYLGLKLQETARAIGTYPEPSMCARVMGTLCFIDLMRGGRFVRNLSFLAAGMIFTQSLGLVVMCVAIGGVLYARTLQRAAISLIFGALLSLIAVPIVSGRSLSSEGSTYIRIMAPINALGLSLTTYPLGAPIGSMEQLSIQSGYFRSTSESKITNGIYEFIIYFGVVGIALSLGLLIYILYLFVIGRTEVSSSLVYLFISTGLSGSFLSIESSLLTYFYIVSARRVRHRAEIYLPITRVSVADRFGKPSRVT